MPYHLVVAAVVIVAVVRFLGAPAPPARARQVVAGVALASFVVPPLLPMGHVVGLVIQISVVAYAVLYQTAATG